MSFVSLFGNRMSSCSDFIYCRLSNNPIASIGCFLCCCSPAILKYKSSFLKINLPLLSPEVVTVRPTGDYVLQICLWCCHQIYTQQFFDCCNPMGKSFVLRLPRASRTFARGFEDFCPKPLGKFNL